MSDSSREYEIIVFGATGYTGKYTAEHVVTNLPTDLKWAIAGRSESKLKQIAEELRQLNPDRTPPGIETAQLEKTDLLRLAKKTKVFISTVGPFIKYGSAAVAACAETGTHYLDCTGEIPWVWDMANKNHETAKRNGAIIIPQNGVESAPSDLMAFALATHIRETLGVGTGELVQVTQELNSAPSGGTLATVMAMFELVPIGTLLKSMKPYSLSLVSAPGENRSRPIFERLTGLRTVKDLGILTDSIQGSSDTPIVYRSWSLYDSGKLYGPNFHINCYAKARNMLQGIFIHVLMGLGMIALALPPMRWLLKKFIYQPGEGRTKEQASGESVEWRGIATADTTDAADPKRAFCKIRWEGSMYHLTGVFLAEAALVISREKTFAHEIGGGLLTPATLGGKYVERVQKAGLKIEVRILPY